MRFMDESVLCYLEACRPIERHILFFHMSLGSNDGTMFQSTPYEGDK